MDEGKRSVDEAATRQPMGLVGAAEMRQKTWEECGIEEKVERLRRVMQDLGLVAQRAERVAGSAQERVIHHRHDAIGLPMMPLDNSRYGGEAGGEKLWMTRLLE